MVEITLDEVHQIQNGLIAQAMGMQFDGGDDAYAKMRRQLLSSRRLSDLVPAIVRRCGDLDQFWAFIKYEHATYKERRDRIWAEFRPLIEHMETGDRGVADESVSQSIRDFGASAIHADWNKALARRSTDPDGAITAARTLVESACKHILDDADIEYGDLDLPRIWALAANELKLLPSQHEHEHEVFKTILGNCQAVVGGLASFRNSAGDAHGKGRNSFVAKPRHAELAVNLAGTMASFLLSTWLERPLAGVKE